MPTTGPGAVPTTGPGAVPTTGPGAVASRPVDSFVAFQSGSIVDCAAWIDKVSGQWRGFGNGGGSLLERERGAWVCIHDGFGGAILVDNRLETSLSRIPRGLYNTMVRPLPWEAGWSNLDRFGAGLESPLWIVLYGLSIFGVWKHRSHLGQLVFPILIIGAVALSGAVTHGNLGTAFRHRGQMLFAFAVLSAGGLQALADWRSGRRNGRGTLDSTNTGGRNPVTSRDLPVVSGT